MTDGYTVFCRSCPGLKEEEYCKLEIKGRLTEVDKMRIRKCPLGFDDPIIPSEEGGFQVIPIWVSDLALLNSMKKSRGGIL